MRLSHKRQLKNKLYVNYTSIQDITSPSERAERDFPSADSQDAWCHCVSEHRKGVT